MDHRTIPDRMRFDYAHFVADPVLRSQEGLMGLLGRMRERKVDLDALLEDAANMISRQYMIADVAIGLKDSDGLYRYKALAGFRENAAEAHKALAYSKDTFYEGGGFHGHDISKFSKIYLEEDNAVTEEEKVAYSRPGLFDKKRRTPTESLEGDYIDIRMLGPEDDLLGWIEISGTRTMKLPDMATLRWIELIASIIAAAVVSQGAHF
jgi:hypothetical protein